MKFPVIKGFDPEAFNKYLKNTGWLFTARVGSLAIKILVGFAVANYLGSTQNGLLNYPLAFVAFFFAASALGLDGFLTRELINYPSKKNELLGSAIALRLLAGLLIIPLIISTFLFINRNNPSETPFLFILIVSFIGIIQPFNIIDSYFQSISKTKYVMYVQISANLLSALIKLILIYIKAPLLFFVFALSVDSLFLAIGYLYSYKNQGNSFSNWKFDFTLSKYLLKNSWPLAFSVVLVTLYMKIDQVMVSNFLGAKQLGIYSTVVGLSESWYFIPVAIVSAIFPALMNAKRDDAERYAKRIENLYDLMVVISLCIAITISFTSDFIYQLFYNKEFAAGADVLSVHIWAGVFVFLGTASSQFLIAEGYTKIAMFRTGVGAIVNIVLNLIWIPKYGIVGAAYATLIAYAVATFFIIFIPKTQKQGILMIKSLFLISISKKIFKS